MVFGKKFPHRPDACGWAAFNPASLIWAISTTSTVMMPIAMQVLAIGFKEVNLFLKTPYRRRKLAQGW